MDEKLDKEAVQQAIAALFPSGAAMHIGITREAAVKGIVGALGMSKELAEEAVRATEKVGAIEFAELTDEEKKALTRPFPDTKDEELREVLRDRRAILEPSELHRRVLRFIDREGIPAPKDPALRPRVIARVTYRVMYEHYVAQLPQA